MTVDTAVGPDFSFVFSPVGNMMRFVGCDTLGFRYSAVTLNPRNPVTCDVDNKRFRDPFRVCQ